MYHYPLRKPITSTVCLASPLLALTGLFTFAGVISYTGAKLLIPSLFPYWGIALVAVLGGWAATSTWLLLTHTGQKLRWFVLTVLIATGVAAGIIPWIALAALLLILLAAIVRINPEVKYGRGRTGHLEQSDH